MKKIFMTIAFVSVMFLAAILGKHSVFREEEP